MFLFGDSSLNDTKDTSILNAMIHDPTNIS